MLVSTYHHLKLSFKDMESSTVSDNNLFIYFFCSIDASKEDGSLGRLVNDDHIAPNCKMKQLCVQGKPRICLFAIMNIAQGTEITYNYSDFNWPWRTLVSK